MLALFLKETDLLSSAPATRFERASGVAVGLFLVVVSALGIRFGSYPCPVLTGVIAAYGTTVLILDLSTALALLCHSNLRVGLAIPLLAAAYIYSGITGFTCIVTLPGVFSSDMLLGAGPQTAVWIWVFWHGGLPLLATSSLFATSATSSVWRRRGVVLLGALTALAAVAIAIYAEPYLPSFVVGGNYHNLMSSSTGIILMGVSGLAVVFVATLTHWRTTIELGLMLALLANFLDVIVTLNGTIRFSLGWYLSKIESFMASGLVLSFMLSELFRVSQRLAEVNRELEALNASDPLTGLPNRRRFDEFLSFEWKRAQRYARPISLIMIDVDQFKKYNDLYGHPAGDECLRLVAKSLRSTVRRETDLCARYGGEEFCVVLVETEPSEAFGVAEAIRSRIEALEIRHEGAGGGPVTVSVGVAGTVPNTDETADNLLRLADKALYDAKRRGRNQVRDSSAESASTRHEAGPVR